MASVELYLGLEHYECSRRTKQGDKVSFLHYALSIQRFGVSQFTQTHVLLGLKASADKLQDQEF